MKKYSTLIVFLFLSINGFSQTYYPLLDSAVNRWYYTANVLPVLRPESTTLLNCSYGNFFFGFSLIMETKGDTVFNGSSYKILEEREYGSPSSCVYGYLREDTASRKVYFVDNIFSPEILLYDFSLAVGSTVPINFMFQGGYYSSGTYTVDSIVTKPVLAGLRRHFYLSHPSLSSHVLEWIEGVGHAGDLVYSYSANTNGFGWFSQCGGFPYDFMQMLTCFEHVPKVYIDSCALQVALTNSCLFLADSCDYWNICGGIDDNSFIKSFDVYPNPSTGFTNIKIVSSESSEAIVNLVSIKGEKVSAPLKTLIIPGLNEIHFDLNRLAPGIYLVQCITDKGVSYRRFIIGEK